jgi:hypothetical protein
MDDALERMGIEELRERVSVRDMTGLVKVEVRDRTRIEESAPRRTLRNELKKKDGAA